MLKTKLLSFLMGLCLFNLLVAGAASAQWADERLGLFDSLVAHSQELDQKSPMIAGRHHGAWGNIAAMASRWPVLRPVIARMAL